MRRLSGKKLQQNTKHRKNKAFQHCYSQNVKMCGLKTHEINYEWPLWQHYGALKFN